MPKKKQPGPSAPLRAGADKPVDTGSSLSVLRAIRDMRREADMAKKARLQKNRLNLDAYLGRHDWSHKQKGQAREWLPEVSIAVEQFSAFVKRALIQFGDWFTVDLAEGNPFKPQEVRALLMCYLNRLAEGNREFSTFALRVSDGVKVGLLESLMVLKVHGFTREEPRFEAESGIRVLETGPEVASRLLRREERRWRLAVDIVRAEEYFPDPSGAGLYEIHSVVRDLHEVEAMAADGIYDQAAVASLREEIAVAADAFEKARRANQDPAAPPGFRKKVKIDEFWGTLLDERGSVAARDVVAAAANDKHLIRPPEPIPWWHGESPFVASPLVRVPGSTWHKALYDDAVGLNVAMSELYSLMLEGGLSSVHGVRQARPDLLMDPRQISDGVPSAITLSLKEDAPRDAKAVEVVATGQVPADALAMFNLTQRQFQSAALTNDLKLGLFPPKQVKATEVIEASQSQSVTLDSIAADVEQKLIAPCLRKGLLTLLQNAENLSTPEVVAAAGPRAALLLARMSPEERFALFANGCSFKVHGISATLARVRDFQKLMALISAVSTNPVLLQAFFQRFSSEKILAHMMKTLNINPDHIEQDADERGARADRLRELPFFQKLASAGQGGGMTAEEAGEPELPAEINQMSNPLTGL